MPATLFGENSIAKILTNRDKAFANLRFSNDGDENYPDEVDLTPGEETHTALVSALRQRARASSTVMQSRHTSWKDVDRVTRAYVRTNSKGQQKGEGDEYKADITNEAYQIVMPISYANRETLMTMLTSSFLGHPIFRYEGTGPEDSFGAELLTLDVDQQMRRSKGALRLYHQMQDAVTYGIGVIAPEWKEVRGRVVERKTTGIVNQGSVTMTGSKKKVNPNGIRWSGVNLRNVDPYSYLPDPNSPPHEIESSEYQGWVDSSWNVLSLKTAQRNDSDFFFNTGYLMDLIDGRSIYSSTDRFGSVAEKKRSTMGGACLFGKQLDIGK